MSLLVASALCNRWRALANLPSFERRHYVAFIRKYLPTEGDKSTSWVLFNDEKVVKAEGDVDEMKKFAYVYFFEMVDA